MILYFSFHKMLTIEYIQLSLKTGPNTDNKEVELLENPTIKGCINTGGMYFNMYGFIDLNRDLVNSVNR